MGETAENVADKYGVTREEMDRYALQSHLRAVLAGKDGISPGRSSRCRWPPGSP